MNYAASTEPRARTQGYRFRLAVLLGLLLALPLFAVYLLVYDRQSASIGAG